MAPTQSGFESIASFVVIFFVSGLLQNRGVVSVSYVLRVRVTSTEHFAETLNWTLACSREKVKCQIRKGILDVVHY